LDILVISPEGSERADRFRRHVAAAGHGARLLPPGTPPDALPAGTGVVLFAEGPAEVGERLRYLGVCLVAVSADVPPRDEERLRTTGAVVLRPDVPDARILQELETRRETAPLEAEVRERVLEPFLEAVRVTLREWAGTEAVVRSVYRRTTHRTFGDVSAVLGLRSATEGALALSFPERTAACLAERILGGVAEERDADMVGDCLGEIANVVAGQAKALLLGTPYHFVLRTPTVVRGAGHAIGPAGATDCLVAAFDGDAGAFALQVLLSL